jgi:hypothetical protein
MTVSERLCLKTILKRLETVKNVDENDQERWMVINFL